MLKEEGAGWSVDAAVVGVMNEGAGWSVEVVVVGVNIDPAEFDVAVVAGVAGPVVDWRLAKSSW